MGSGRRLITKSRGSCCQSRTGPKPESSAQPCYMTAEGRGLRLWGGVTGKEWPRHLETTQTEPGLEKGPASQQVTRVLVNSSKQGRKVIVLCIPRGPGGLLSRAQHLQTLPMWQGQTASRENAAPAAGWAGERLFAGAQIFRINNSQLWYLIFFAAV